MKREQHLPVVVIGMDPHKRSVTIEVMAADETIVRHAARRPSVAQIREALLADN